MALKAKLFTNGDPRSSGTRLPPRRWMNALVEAVCSCWIQISTNGSNRRSMKKPLNGRYMAHNDDDYEYKITEYFL